MPIGPDDRRGDRQDGEARIDGDCHVAENHAIRQVQTLEAAALAEGLKDDQERALAKEGKAVV